MTVTDQINQLVAKLPPEKSESVLQFARFLCQQANDEAWERSLTAATKSQRFAQELVEVDRDIAEGKATRLSAEGL